MSTTSWRRIGEWRYTSTHSLTSALDGGEWSPLHPGRFTPQGKSPWYPLDRRLGGPQSRSGRRGEEKIPSPRRESNPMTPIFQPVAHRLWFTVSVIIFSIPMRYYTFVSKMVCGSYLWFVVRPHWSLCCVLVLSVMRLFSQWLGLQPVSDSELDLKLWLLQTFVLEFRFSRRPFVHCSVPWVSQCRTLPMFHRNWMRES
jgi:hypothetical protein